MSEYSQIQAKLINVLNRKVVKHKTVYKSDNNVIVIDGKTKYYYTIHRIENTNMGILIPSNMNNTKANCWYIVGKNLFDGGGNPDTHEYIDLGLPSGTLWATENIKDANGNELYFAWGETQGYTAEQVGTTKNFTWNGENNDYAFGPINWLDQESAGMTKYNKTDGKIILDTTDDAATSNWGVNWKMPTKEQFEELIANTTAAWTQVDGVSGMLFTSTINTNTLFFPAVGYAGSGNIHDIGSYCYCWSVSLNNESISLAWMLYFRDGYCEMGSGSRCNGYSVRPIRVNN